jgi:PPK2 family polyphosphate:nucleotide phosphotransferase
MMNARERFRIGKKLRLDDADAAATPLTSGDKAKDKSRVEKLSEEIGTLQDILYAEHARKVLIVLQGLDSSGKDGTVRAVFSRIDPLGIRCVPFRAPTESEREHDFLWRVHQQVPAQGEMVIFNRSHYEDVLVPKVYGRIDDKECDRRYAHICDFERMLAETGTVLLKFFLHISKDEQKERLEARVNDPRKHWKFDMHDLEDRKLWTDYQRAYEKAIHETDAGHAPWYVIPADSKTHRNLAIASIVLETMEDMKFAYPPARPELAALKIE